MDNMDEQKENFSREMETLILSQMESLELQIKL